MARNPLDMPSPEGAVRGLLGRLEEQAAAGNWTEVENLIARLRGALLDVPEKDRRALIIDVQRVTEDVTRIALEARDDLTTKITTLRRGQAAAKAYELR